MATTPTPVNASANPQDHRRHLRSKLDIRVVWVQGTGSTVRGAVGRACDLSEGGISAVLPTRIALGASSDLLFTLPGAKQELRVHVVVRSVEGFRYGFEFLTLSQPQREAIRRACERMSVLHP